MTNTPEPSAHQAHQAIPPGPGAAGKPGRRRVVVNAALTALAVLAVAALVFQHWWALRDPPEPGWLAAEELPEAKPAWTEQMSDQDSPHVHDGFLLRVDASASRVNVTVRDLGTGQTRLKLADHEYKRVWLSGEFLLAQKRDASRPSTVTVFELDTGDVVRTIEFTHLGKAVVASGILVGNILDENGDQATRGVAVDSGKELWTKPIDTSSSKAGWLRPIFPPSPVKDDEYDYFQPESDAPVVIAERGDIDPQHLWDHVDAIDVATGEVRWSDPVDYSDFRSADTTRSHLTEGGDILVSVDHDADSKTNITGTSIVVDAKSGKTTSYPLPRKVSSYPRLSSEIIPGNQDELQGDTLAVDDAGEAALIDVATEKTRRKVDVAENQLFANAGDVVFSEFTIAGGNTFDPAENGVRAVDVDTGEKLWDRPGNLTGGIAVYGDLVVTPTLAKDAEELYFGGFTELTGLSAQVFDKRTGTGKWQVDDAKVIGHSDDYLVFTTEQGTVSVVPVDG